MRNLLAFAWLTQAVPMTAAFIVSSRHPPSQDGWVAWWFTLAHGAPAWLLGIVLVTSTTCGLGRALDE